MSYNFIQPQHGGGAWYHEVNPTRTLPMSSHIPTGGWRGMRGMGAVPSHSYPESSVIPGYWRGYGAVGSTMFGQDAKTTDETPTISGISVGSGPVEGGTAFELYGSGFGMGTQVYFRQGSILRAAPITSVTSSKIMGKTPPMAAGPVNIQVKTKAGIETTFPNAFSFVQKKSFWDELAGGLTQLTQTGLTAYRDVQNIQHGNPSGTPGSNLSVPPPPGSPAAPITIKLEQGASGASKPPWGIIGVGAVAVLGIGYFLLK